MGIFSTIMDKIFHHPSAVPPPAQAAPRPAATPAAAKPAAAKPATPPPQPVDVAAVLTKIAADKGRPSNWQVSIVDLLQLLDMDSSLNARKELADELNVHVAADGTAAENIALHKAVMAKLAANGGKLPDSLRH